MYFTFNCLFLLLQSLFTPVEMTRKSCYEFWNPSTYMKADIILGAFIPIFILLEGPKEIQQFIWIQPDIVLENILLQWKNYQYLMTLYFAIDEINKDTHLLPNVTLGFHIYNAFNFHPRTLEGPLMWLSGRNEFIPNYKCKTQYKALGIISGTRSEYSAGIGSLLERYKIPQVSFALLLQVNYGPFDSMLSDKDTFPSLYQMSPKDTALTQGVISVLLHFGWKWVGVIVSDDLKGMEFLSHLKAEMVSEDICVAFTKSLKTNWKVQYTSGVGLANLNHHPQVNVNILYGDIDDLLYFCLENKLLSSRRKVWIMAKLHLVYLESVFFKRKDLINFFTGSLLFSKKRNIPGFKNFLESLTPSYYPGEFYFYKFWIDKFDCAPPALLCGRNKPCPLNITLKNKEGENDIMIPSEASYSIWNTVYAVAHAIHNMFLRKTEIGSHEDKNHDRFLPWQTPQSVCTQSCGPGFWKILQEERPVCCFSCVPCPEKHISNLTDQQKCIACLIQEYPNPERNHCLPKSATFLSFEDPLGMSLACMALGFSVSTAAVLGIFLKYQDSPIIKANNLTLSYILLISLLLCFLCSFLFIGHPNTVSCILQQITFALVFTLALSTVLAKTITVILAFRALKPGRTMRRLFVLGIYNAVIPFCVLIQLITSGIWLATSPPYIDTDSYSEHAHIIILCNNGSVTAFYCMLVYLGTLALGSFTVAFLARNLPDTFNEAKFLTFSMVVFCSVWVTFVPVYQSTKAKAMVAVEVFSILASSAGLLACIFFPKCYIILREPDKRNLKCFKNKTRIKK
uniref:Parathyroid cell calcium-sensing receptor n=1 Tax=Mus musculus TaxID=10090 RepID=A0A3B2WCD9_MOUSE